jgi:thiamine-phosphate pyrophosphorylase
MAVSLDTAPRLLAVSDYGSCAGAADWRARTLRLADALLHLESPHVCLQVRLKTLGGLHRRAMLAALRADLHDSIRAGLRVALNGSTREALELGYDKVHWPEALIPLAPPGVRRSLAASASVHSLTAARQARAAGAAYVVFGPVFTPSTKQRAGVGLGELAAMAREWTGQLVAIGGLRPDRIAACLQAGAAGVAAVSDLLNAADPERRVREYWSILAASEDEQRARPPAGMALDRRAESS